MVNKVRYLSEIKSRVWKYRRTIPANPKELRERIGYSDFTQTWREDDTDISIIFSGARRLAKVHDDIIERARGGEVFNPNVLADVSEPVKIALTYPKEEQWSVLQILNFEKGTVEYDAAKQLLSNNGHGQNTDHPWPLSESLKYEKENFGDKDMSTTIASVNSFIEEHGDICIKKIRRKDVRDWIKKISSTLAPTTVDKRRRMMQLMLNNRFRDEEYNGANPFSGHKIENKTNPKDARLPFNKAAIKAIDQAIKGPKVEPDYRNVLKLMKCTGARTGEVGGLALADVTLDVEIPYIQIRPNNFRSIKTDKSEREVPLVGDALKAAKDAVKRAKLRQRSKPSEDVQLFPSYICRENGSSGISSALAKFIKKEAGIPNTPRLSPYSYRHSLTAALEKAEVSPYVQDSIFGHTGESLRRRTYGESKTDLKIVHQALTKAMRHLGDVNKNNYEAWEWME